MIVVDTNIVAYALIEGEHTVQSRALWRADPDWRLPVFWRYEFLNILATFVRRGGMDRQRAERLWTSAREWSHPMECTVDGAAALRLAIEQDVSAYDAQFVVLAQLLGILLVSENARLSHQCPETVVSMSDYLAQ